MASRSDKTMMMSIGLVLLVGGAGLAYWGYQMSHSLASHLSQAFIRTVLKYYYDDTAQLVCQIRPAEIENTTV